MLNGETYALTGGNGGGYELCEVYHFRSPTLRPGFQPAHGGLIANAASLYPEAWAYLQTVEGQLLCKTEAEWQALSTANPWNGIGGVPWFVQDLQAGTLRLMDLRGMFAEAAGFDGFDVGGRHPDAIVNITGELGIKATSSSGPVGAWGEYPGDPAKFNLGAFSLGPPVNSYRFAVSGEAVISNTFRLDASRVVRTANKVAPRAWGALTCVYLGQPQGV